MSGFIYETIQVALLIIAVIVLCGFRYKKYFKYHLGIVPTNPFCERDKDVWLPRFYIWNNKNQYNPNYKPNYEIAKYGKNYFFLYSGGKVQSPYCAYILSPHFVFISFILNGLQNDVHIIAFSTAVAILIPILLNPDFIFFTPLILLCASFLGVQFSLDVHSLGLRNPNYDTSLDISDNRKLQNRFVKPSYLFFSIASLMSELSILLLTMQAVCCFYRESGPLRVINLLCTCALLGLSIYEYRKSVPGFYKKNTKDVFILLAEMAILSIAVIIVNAFSSQVIHFKVAPTYIFLITAVLTLVVESISSHILSIYVPSKSKLKKYQKKYNYKENKSIFPDYTFIESYEVSKLKEYREYYLPKEELERIRKLEKQERERKEKEKKERILWLEEKAAKLEPGLDKYKAQLDVLFAKNEQQSKEARRLMELIREEEKKIQRQKDLDAHYKYMAWRAEHATMWLGGERVTPEEYDQFCRRYGYGKYRVNPDAPDELEKKEKEGGYSDSVDSTDATDRFNKRRR